MIYKFKSKVAGDVIMLEPHGDQILRIVGKEPSAQGVFEVADMPAAIAAVEQAVAADEATSPQDEATSAGSTATPADRIGLRQRAWPLREMLKRCHAEGAVVVWGA